MIPRASRAPLLIGAVPRCQRVFLCLLNALLTLQPYAHAEQYWYDLLVPASESGVEFWAHAWVVAVGIRVRRMRARSWCNPMPRRSFTKPRTRYLALFVLQPHMDKWELT